MPRGDRADRRRRREQDRQKNAEFRSRMATAEEQLRQQVQQRFVRSSDQSMKIDSHGASLAERSQKMAIERLRLAMELAERKAGLAAKWIEVGLKGEELAQMRIARREWSAAITAIKRELRAAQKEAERWNRWLAASEELIWGSLANPATLVKAWRGLFAAVFALPRADQRAISQIKCEPADVRPKNFHKPSNPDWKWPGDDLTGKTAMRVFDYCRDNRLIPADGSSLQQKLFEVMEAVDLACAKLAAEHMAHVEADRAELKLMRETHWKRQKVS